MSSGRTDDLKIQNPYYRRSKYQIGPTIQLIHEFSKASGLHLNIEKCEILSLFDTDDEYTKDMLPTQQLNFLPRLKKTKNIMNMWLQRDLSVFGRILLTKAEGICFEVLLPFLNLW